MSRQERFTASGDFSTRLREARREMGLTQAEFARLGGVVLNSQNRYENGGTEPSIGYLLNLEGAGVDWYWILTGQRISGAAMSAEAADLLDLFQQLPAALQAELLRHVRALRDFAVPASDA